LWREYLILCQMLLFLAVSLSRCVNTYVLEIKALGNMAPLTRMPPSCSICSLENHFTFFHQLQNPLPLSVSPFCFISGFVLYRLTSPLVIELPQIPRPSGIRQIPPTYQSLNPRDLTVGDEVSDELAGEGSVVSHSIGDDATSIGTTSDDKSTKKTLTLRGQMLYMPGWNAILFLGTPV